MMEETRIDSEWIALNAFRGLLKIATKGDVAKSTYNIALELGGKLYPQLLGAETSLLYRSRESDTTKEYRQRAGLRSIRDGKTVHPLNVLQPEIEQLEELLRVAKQNKLDSPDIDQLKNRLDSLLKARQELSTESHTENQLIFRDAYNVERDIPKLETGRGYRDFQLPNANILRIRVLHPDKPEHVSGADILYERHAPCEEKASLVAVQYKIWDNKKLYLSDRRMTAQLTRLAGLICGQGICNQDSTQRAYRFPHCAAFLRPTDRLQKPDQSFISTGEHLPVCHIQDCKTQTERGVEVLEYDKIRPISISSEEFEYLFNKGKIGSRMLDYAQLSSLYQSLQITDPADHMTIHAQEFLDSPQDEEFPWFPESP